MTLCASGSFATHMALYKCVLIDLFMYLSMMLLNRTARTPRWCKRTRRSPSAAAVESTRTRRARRRRRRVVGRTSTKTKDKTKDRRVRRSPWTPRRHAQRHGRRPLTWSGASPTRTAPTSPVASAAGTDVVDSPVSSPSSPRRVRIIARLVYIDVENVLLSYFLSRFYVFNVFLFCQRLFLNFFTRLTHVDLQDRARPVMWRVSSAAMSFVCSMISGRITKNIGILTGLLLN